MRAGNGTRTRDPNLGKVVLYQLSYSRNFLPLVAKAADPPYLCASAVDRVANRQFNHFIRRYGGEGNRTPDLLNAIQALSQLSYTPVQLRISIQAANKQRLFETE